MHNHFKKGSEPYYAAEPIVKALDTLEGACEDAVQVVSDQEDEIEEKQSEIDDLEAELQDLQNKLDENEKRIVDMSPRDECIRILRNIRLYCDDSIVHLERDYGSKVEEKKAEIDSGEQPKKEE